MRGAMAKSNCSMASSNCWVSNNKWYAKILHLFSLWGNVGWDARLFKLGSLLVKGSHANSLYVWDFSGFIYYSIVKLANALLYIRFRFKLPFRRNLEPIKSLRKYIFFPWMMPRPSKRTLFSFLFVRILISIKILTNDIFAYAKTCRFSWVWFIWFIWFILILRFTRSALRDIGRGLRPIRTKGSGATAFSFILPISRSCSPIMGYPWFLIWDCPIWGNFYWKVQKDNILIH